MKRNCVLLAVACGLTVVSGQWLEATIPVPQPPQALCWNEANNRLYCAVGYPAAYGAVVVIDGDSNVVLDTLMLGYDMPGRVIAGPTGGLVYCTGSSYYPLDDSLVTVIDAGEDSIVAQVQVGGGPMALCLDAAGERLFCAAQMPGRVYVVDCAGDTVRAVLPVGSNPYDLCYVPGLDRVFCANRGTYGRADYTVTSIDAAGDSVRRSIEVGLFPRALCYNRTQGKVYCANGWSASVSVLDAAGDSTLASVAVGGAPFAVAWNPVTDRVYCADADNDWVSVIDGVTNSLLGTVSLPGPAWSLAVDSAVNKVYASCFLDNAVAVIDGDADTVMVTVPVGVGPREMCRSPATGRTYVADEGGQTVSVIRDTVTAGIEEKAEGGRTKAEQMLPTVVRGTLLLPRDMTDFGSGKPDRVPRPVLLDITGREVMSIVPGENDVSHLASGIYFVQERGSRGRGSEGPRVRKVVVQR